MPYSNSQIAGFPPFFVVDNFYDDPDEVRYFAVHSEYKKPLISSTPALISNVRHPNTKDTLFRIGEIVNCIPDWDTVDDVYEFWGQAACGEFQLSLEHLNCMGQVHSHKNGEWVGIVYLSSPEHCNGRDGTYLVKHVTSNLCHFSQITNEQYENLKTDARDQSKWEVIVVPPMKYNRLFLFDSRVFHAESPGFGRTPSDGRLVQIFNFKSVQPT